MGGEVDTVFVDVEFRLDSLDLSLREMQQRSQQAGEQAGQGLGDGMNRGLEGGLRGAFDRVPGAAARAGQQAGDALGEGLADGARRGAEGLGDAVEGAGRDAGTRGGGALSGALGSALGGLGGLAAGAVATAGAAVVAGITAAAGSALSIAQQANQGVLDMQAQLGVTADEATELGEVAKRVFAGNWGESLGEAQQMVIEVRRQMKGLAEEDIEGAVSKAAALSDTFGEDVGDIANAANALMSELGVSSNEAFDIIAKGFQSGLNNSGDMLDTLGEYSAYFGEAGFSGQEFFSILETGQKSGILGIDKIGDTIKEFGIRMAEGGKDITDGMDSIGLSADEVNKKVASGAMTQAQAFELIKTKLGEVKDKQEQYAAGQLLFGTQFEDLARSGVLAVNSQKTAMQDIAGAADKVAARYNTLGQMMQGAWRQVLLQLEPVGQEILKLGNQAMPVVSAAIKSVGPVITAMVQGAVAGFRSLNSAIGPGVQQGVQTFKSIIATIAPYVVTVVNGIRPVLASLGPLFQAAFGVVGALWNGVLRPVLAAIAPAFRVAFGLVASTVQAAVQVVTGVLNAVAALMRGDVAGAVRALQNIFTTAGATMGRAMQSAATAILGALRGLPAQMAGIARDIVAGLVNGIRAGAGAVGDAARNLAQNAIASLKAKMGIQSPSRVMHELGVFTGQGFVNGIASKEADVRRVALNTARSFLDAFKDLQVERQLGQVDLSAYRSTLENAAAALRSKLATVKEGSAAYSEWLKALGTVQAELGKLDAQAKRTGASTQTLIDEASRGRAEIAKTEGWARYTEGLRSATSAQLAQALVTARSSGDVQRYNAVRAEQERREKAVSDAQDRSRESAERQRRQLADNRAQIARTEETQRYTLALKGMGDAELATRLSVARAAGEVEKYNLIRAEQKRRADEVSAAQDKAAEAARREAEAVAQGRKAIAEARSYEQWRDGLRDLTDAELDSAAAAEESAGKQSRYNDVMAEKKRRTDEAAQALSDLADAEIRAANAAAQRDPQGAMDSAYRQSYGVGEEGLVAALADLTGLSLEQVSRDIDAALTDLERWNRAGAETLRRVYGDVLRERQQATAIAERETADMAAYFGGLASDAISRAEDLQKAGDYAGAVRELETAVGDLNAEAGDSGQAAEGLLKLSAALGKLRQERAALTGDARARAEFREILEETLPMDSPSAARGQRPIPPAKPDPGVAARPQRTPVIPAVASDPRRGLSAEQREWQDRTRATEDAQRAADAYAASLRLMTDAELAAAQASAFSAGKQGQYALTLAETERRTRDAEAAQKTWNDNLSQIGFQAWTASLREMTDAQIQSGIETSRTNKNVAAYNAYVAEANRRSTSLADGQQLVADTTAELNRTLRGGEKPWEKQIDALLKAKGQSKELDAQIDALVGRLRELQAQSAQQQGLERLKNQVGQVGDIVGKTFAMFGADSEIQQGIGQFTSGIQDGITAFGKFSSGDILGGIQAALSGIMNIGNAVENISPGLKAWKKGLLEVAAIEKEMVGARQYGNVKNPYYDTLMRDAAERERAGNSKWYQRLGWSIFGGAPQYMSDEAAKFMAESARIFGEVAEAVVGGMDEALMNAFETGDWTGTEEAMQKNLNTLMAKMVLQAIVTASDMQARIQAFAEAMNRAMLDGKIDATEQAELDRLQRQIEAEQQAIMNRWRTTAPRLRGYGQGVTPEEAAPSAPEPSDVTRTVRVDMPDVSASINFDVLSTLATVIERAAPKFEAGGAAVLEGGGRWLAGMDRLERLLSGAELRPDTRALRGL